MPTFKKRKTNRGLFSESLLNDALCAMKKDNLSLRSAAEQYDIPKSTLHRYSKSQVENEEKVAKLSVVTTQVKKNFIKWFSYKYFSGFTLYLIT